jgi:hypothetical protein
MTQVPKLSNKSQGRTKNHKLNVSLGVAVGLMLGIVFYFSSDFGIEILYIGIVAAVFTTLGMYHVEHEEHLHSSYSNTLKEYDLDQLIQLSKSQELNDTERGLVVKYLNKNHSGWSLISNAHLHQP